MRALLIAAIVAVSLAQADTYFQRSLHDIPWYAAHPAERRATQQFCERNEAYAMMPDCVNAEHAGVGTLGQRYSGFSIPISHWAMTWWMGQ